MTFHKYSWPFLDVLCSCLPDIVNQTFLKIKHFFILVNIKDPQWIYLCIVATNNFTNNLISWSQMHFSVVKESQIPFKPHPAPVCKTEIMKKITLAISWQTCLPQHTRKGTAAEGEAVSPPAVLCSGAFGAQGLCPWARQVTASATAPCPNTSLPHHAQTQA